MEQGDRLMAHWLMKSEPDVFGWDDLTERGAKGEQWDGVRSYQARNNMIAMKKGEQAFFYHSNEGKAIVGIAEIIAEAHPDSTAHDPKWQCVDVRALRPLKNPVTLADCKAEPRLKDMVLVNNSRLSVQPVTDEEWAVVLEMAGG